MPLLDDGVVLEDNKLETIILVTFPDDHPRCGATIA